MIDYWDAYARLRPRIVIDEVTGCWIWTGAMRGRGYGYMKVKDYFPDGTFRWINYSTHKVTYELVNGVLAPKLVVRHGCDVTQCCFPEHLVSGTSNENMQDMIARRRGKNQFQSKREYDGSPRPDIPF